MKTLILSNLNIFCFACALTAAYVFIRDDTPIQSVWLIFAGWIVMDGISLLFKGEKDAG